MESKWVNRIVGHEEVPPDQLLSHPDNWRIHPKFQQEALRGVINDIGFIKSVTVNKRTGRVVDGHLRVTLALRDQIPLIPVEYVDLSEEEEAEALLTIDPIAALAASDKENLDHLLRRVNTDQESVMKLLEQTAAQAGLIDKLDYQAEWAGMPEFDQEDLAPEKQILVNFATLDDYEDFQRLIGQKLTEKTKSTWHPEVKRVDRGNYIDES